MQAGAIRTKLSEVAQEKVMPYGVPVSTIIGVRHTCSGSFPTVSHPTSVVMPIPSYNMDIHMRK